MINVSNFKSQVATVVRDTKQKLENIPALGMLLSTPFGRQLLAARDSITTAVCGSIGLWLAPIFISVRHDLHVGMVPILARIATATLGGGVLILIPSLVAPLYLLAADFHQTRRLRSHQVALFICSFLIALFALMIDVAKITGDVPDSAFVLSASEWGAGISCFLLYLYFLTRYLPDNILQEVQRSGTILTDEVLAHRKAEMP